MNWPSGPPPMPGPGWYPDPEQASTWRWWDGTQWTQLRAPMATAPTADPQSFSAWSDQTVRSVKAVLRRVGALIVVASVAVGLAAVALTLVVLRSNRGRELRRLLGDDFSRDPIVLTDAEADRVWELVQELFWAVLPFAAVLFVAYVVVVAWSYALAVGATRDDADTGVASLSRAAIRRVPALIGTGLVLGAVATAVLAVAVVGIAAVVTSGADGALIAIVVVCLVVAVVVLAVWLWGRLSLAFVGAALGGHGLGIGRSWELTTARFWFVVGRLLVVFLVAGALEFALSSIGNVIWELGLVVGIVVIMAFGAIANAVRTIVTAVAQVVIVDQLEGVPTPAGSSGESVQP